MSGNGGEMGSEEKSNKIENRFTEILDYVDRLFDIDNHKFLVGLNSGLVAAVITTSYRNPALALTARIFLPPICGLTAAISWQYFITKRLESRELECPVCAYMRGFILATASASIIPLAVGGLVIARRSRGFLAQAEKFTENFSENFMRRPFLVAAVLAQGGTGYIMASREFEKFLKEHVYKNKNGSLSGRKE